MRRFLASLLLAGRKLVTWFIRRIRIITSRGAAATFIAIGVVARLLAVPVVLGMAALLGVSSVAALVHEDGLATLQGSLVELGLIGETYSVSQLRSRIGYGVAAFGGGVVLATLRDLVKTAPSLAAFIVSPSLDGIFRPALAMFVATAGLSLSAFALNLGGKTGGDPGASMAFHIGPSCHVGVGNEILATFFLTFSEEATTESLRAGHGEGLDLPEWDDKMIEGLVADLAECVGAEASEIELQVVGMASSSPFKGESEAASRPLNRELANRRALVVQERLQREIQKLDPVTAQRIRVQALAWETYEDMANARRFRDRHPDGRPSSAMARLTRRAEIHILSAGMCQLSLPFLAEARSVAKRE